jgi:cyanate permease
LPDWEEKQRLAYVLLVGTWSLIALGAFYLMLFMHRRRQNKYGTQYMCLGAFATSKTWQRVALFLSLLSLLASTILCVVLVFVAEEFQSANEWAIVIGTLGLVSLAAVLDRGRDRCYQRPPAQIRT